MTPSPPLFHKVSPTGPREIMNHNKVLQVSEENKQVLSAVEALLSLSPLIHQDVATKKRQLVGQGEAESTTLPTAAGTMTTSSLATPHHDELRTTDPKSTTRAAGTVSPCEDDESSSSSSSHSSAAVSSSTTYYEGSCDLWCPEDEECLSPLHCFMRKYCVEAFTAKEFDISTPKFGRSLGRSISVGQVGVQCKWCKHRNYVDRPERAVCFPSTIKNIYHSIETWQRRHSTVCTDIPKWAKTQMTSLMKCSRSGAGGRRLYWEESAVRLGMVDTDTGVRFFRPPGTIDPPPMKQQHILQVHSVSTSSSTSLAADHTAEITTSVLVTTVSHPIVRPHDLELQITGYLYTLLEQMESCYFSDEDRIGGRSKVKSCQLGYPGIQCKHCGGKSGFGRYFPASCAALSSANSDRNIFNHISKCRKCPEQVRDSLTTLFKQQNTLKNRRGTRKIFFQRIWARMHQLKEDDLEVATQSSTSSSPSRTTPPPRVVRENDRASSPVWQEPKPPQPPRPEVSTKFVQEQPIVMMMYHADETLPPSRVFHEPPPIIMRRQDELTTSNNKMFQEPPCIMMRRHDELTTSNNKMFQEPPPIIMRRHDESFPIQMHRELPNTMMPLMRCEQLPIMQQVLAHEQEIHHQQQQHLRNMQQQHQARQHQQQHYREAMQHQQQHQFLQQQQPTMQQQQQQEMQQRLMVQRPTAQRPYVQFSSLADPQASTTLHQYSIPPYLYRQLPPSDSTSNVTSV